SRQGAKCAKKKKGKEALLGADTQKKEVVSDSTLSVIIRGEFSRRPQTAIESSTLNHAVAVSNPPPAAHTSGARRDCAARSNPARDRRARRRGGLRPIRCSANGWCGSTSRAVRRGSCPCGRAGPNPLSDRRGSAPGS